MSMKKKISVIIFLLIFFYKCVEAQIVPSAHLLFIKSTVVDESKFVFSNMITHLHPISDSLILVWGYPSNAGLYNFQTGKLKLSYSFEKVNIDSVITKIIQPIFINRKYVIEEERVKYLAEYPATKINWFWVNGSNIVWNIDFLAPYFNYINNKSGRHLENIYNIQYTSSLVTTDLFGRIEKIKWFVGEDELNCGYYLSNGYYFKDKILYALQDYHFNFMSEFQDYDLSKNLKIIALRDRNKSIIIDTSLTKYYLPIENKISYRFWSLRMLMSNKDSLVGDGVGIYKSENLFPVKESFYEKLNNRTFMAFTSFNKNNNILFQASKFKNENSKETISYQLVNYDLVQDKIIWEENIGDGNLISQFAFWKNNLIYIQKNGEHYEFIQNRILY